MGHPYMVKCLVGSLIGGEGRERGKRAGGQEKKLTPRGRERNQGGRHVPTIVLV